jgi:ketosteroid isomerase-like protein
MELTQTGLDDGGLAAKKETVRRFILDMWGQADGGALMDELVATDFVDHQPWGDVSAGIEEQKRQHGLFHQAFDITTTLLHVIAEGDLVCDHWTGVLTHKGEFMGIPATGTTFSVHALDLHRLADGKIAESWHLEDFPLRLIELRAAADGAAQ